MPAAVVDTESLAAHSWPGDDCYICSHEQLTRREMCPADNAGRGNGLVSREAGEECVGMILCRLYQLTRSN